MNTKTKKIGYVYLVLCIMFLGMVCFTTACGKNKPVASFEKLLPKGVKLGMTENEVIKVLGEPVDIIDIPDNSKEMVWKNMQFNNYNANFYHGAYLDQFNYVSWVIAPMKEKDIEEIFEETLAFLQKEYDGKLVKTEGGVDMHDSYKYSEGDYSLNLDILLFQGEPGNYAVTVFIKNMKLKVK